MSEEGELQRCVFDPEMLDRADPEGSKSERGRIMGTAEKVLAVVFGGDIR